MREPFKIGKATIKESADSILIRVPASKNWLVFVMLSVWVGIWFWFLIWAIAMSLTLSQQQIDIGSALLAFTFWFVFGAFPCYTWLRMGFGYELVEFQNLKIVLQQNVVFLKRQRQYELLHIERLRILKILQHSILSEGYTMEYKKQALAFDYEDRPVSFASGINEAEADQIIKFVRSKFPQYRLWS